MGLYEYTFGLIITILIGTTVASVSFQYFYGGYDLWAYIMSTSSYLMGLPVSFEYFNNKINANSKMDKNHDEAMANSVRMFGRFDDIEKSMTMGTINAGMVNIHNDMSSMRQNIKTISNNIGTLRNTIRRDKRTVRNDIGSLRSEMKTVRSDIGSLRNDIGSLNRTVDNLSTRLIVSEDAIETIKWDVSEILSILRGSNGIDVQGSEHMVSSSGITS